MPAKTLGILHTVISCHFKLWISCNIYIYTIFSVVLVDFTSNSIVINEGRSSFPVCIQVTSGSIGTGLTISVLSVVQGENGKKFNFESVNSIF